MSWSLHSELSQIYISHMKHVSPLKSLLHATSNQALNSRMACAVQQCYSEHLCTRLLNITDEEMTVSHH